MAEAPKPPPLAEGQLEIMNIVWDRGEITVGEVWKLLSERRPVARNTVQTMITRLAEKGWLRARDDGQAARYSAAQPRGRVMKSMVSRFVETAFRGSAEGLVIALVEGRGLSKEEAERIRAILNKAEEGRP
jgi:predicted transcriptional regulator